MTPAGVVVLDLLALALLVWVLNLVRLGRLYVGYGALFVATLAFVAVAASVPPLARLLESGLERLFPSAGATLLGFAFVLCLLVYILTQMTILSNRLSSLVQEIALSRAEDPQDAPRGAETKEASRPAGGPGGGA